MNKYLVILTIVLAGLALPVFSQRMQVDTLLIKELLRQNEFSRIQIQQLTKEISDLKLQSQRQQKAGQDKFTAAFQFIDAAASSANNLQALVMKESYRNKIASLNNPTSNELGFSLEMEINNALKPLLEKTKKTNTNKFSQVVGSFLETGKRSSGQLFPAGNVFTSIVGMVGNLTVQEKGIDQQDLVNFIKSIEKYFIRYERLHQSNQAFNAEMEKMKSRLKLLQDDIKLLLLDMIVTLDRSLKRTLLKPLSSEELMLKYFNPQKIQDYLARGAPVQFPQDAIKSCKEISNNIQRIYDEYSLIYNNNYKEIRSIISDTKNVSLLVDQVQLNKTLKDIESLYTESKAMDADNLRLKTLQERLEMLLQ
jgi:hypothetical protein